MESGRKLKSCDTHKHAVRQENIQQINFTMIYFADSKLKGNTGRAWHRRTQESSSLWAELLVTLGTDHHDPMLSIYLRPQEIYVWPLP